MSKAKVDQSRCLGCGMCKESCPSGAIDMNASQLAEVDETKCTGCGSCTKVCPGQAIENK